MNEDERNLYEKLSEMFQEEDASTIIDLPGKDFWNFWKEKTQCLKYLNCFSQPSMGSNGNFAYSDLSLGKLVSKISLLEFQERFVFYH